MLFLITARQRSCRKVMFSVVCVSSQRVFHVTFSHDILDLTIKSPQPHSPRPQPPLYRDTPNLSPSHPAVASGGHDWRLVLTCSLEDPPTSADIWWLDTAAYMVCEWMVCILSECFLVSCYVFGNICIVRM